MKKKILTLIIGICSMGVLFAGCENLKKHMYSPKERNTTKNVSIADAVLEEWQSVWDGYYLKSPSGYDLIVNMDGAPIKIVNATNNPNIFNELNNGDLIKVVSGYIEESYPGTTWIYYCEKQKDGTIDNIPADTIKELVELGFLDAKDYTTTEVETSEVK